MKYESMGGIGKGIFAGGRWATLSTLVDEINITRKSDMQEQKCTHNKPPTAQQILKCYVTR